MSFTDLTPTQTFAKFPDAPRNAPSVRSGLTLLGHFGLLVMALGFAAAVSSGSMLAPYSYPVIFSGPAVVGSWIILGNVSWGILSDSFRPAGMGAIYGAGLAASLWLGDSLLGAAWLFGGGYLAISFLLTFVVGVVWLDSRLNSPA